MSLALFSSIQSQSNSSSNSAPTTQEKENWFYGTGNVDNTSTPRKNIQSFFEYFRDTKYMVGTIGDTQIYLYTSFFDLALSPDVSIFVSDFLESYFPLIDWTNYSTRRGNYNNWTDYINSYPTADDICDVWADAENKGKILVS